MNARSTTLPARDAATAVPNERGGTARNTRLLEAELQAERRHAEQLEARLRLAQATLRQVLTEPEAAASEPGQTGNGTPSPESAQAMLRQALEQLEEERVTAIELRTVLAATETRVEALHSELSARGEERAGRVRKSARTIEKGRRQQAALEKQLEELGRRVAEDAVALQLLDDCRKAARSLNRHLSSDEELQRMLESTTRDLAQRQQELEEIRARPATTGAAPPVSGTTSDSAEADGALPVARLRDTEEMLRQSLDELEDQRIQAVELRTVLAATEHRIGSLAEELAARERSLEIERKKHAQERKRDHKTLADAVAQRDTQRQAAAEARTMLLALEGRMRTLEGTVAARERERDTLRLQLAREREAARARRTESDASAADRARVPRLQAALRSLRRRAQRLEEKTVAHEHATAARHARFAKEQGVQRELRLRLAAAEAESHRLRALCTSAESTERRLHAEQTDLRARLEHALAAGAHETRRLDAELRDARATCKRAELDREQNEAELVALQRKVEELRRERERARKLLQETEERRQQAETAVAELRTALAAEEQRRLALQAELTERESEVAALQDSMTGERADQAALQQQLDRSAEELQAAREREGVRAREIRDLMARCRDLGAQIGEAQASEQRMRAELSALQRLRADESPELERLRQEVSALAEERQTLDRQLAASRRRCEELQEELAAAGETASTLEEKQEELHSAQSELASLQHRITEFERTVQAARAHEKERAAEVQQLGERSTALAARLAESEGREGQLRRQLDELQCEIEVREEDAERLRTESRRASERSQELQTHVAGLEAAATAAAERESSLESRVRELVSQGDRLGTELATQDEHRRAAEDSIRTLQAKLATANAERERTVAELGESRRCAEVLERELREARALLEEREAAVADLEERCTQEMAEHERLLEELTAAQRVRQEHEAQGDTIREQLAAAREREQELCARIAEQESMIESAEAATAELRQQLEQATLAAAEAVEPEEDDQDTVDEDEGVLVLSEELNLQGDTEPLRLAADDTGPGAAHVEPASAAVRNGKLSVIHLEDDAATREALRATIDGRQEVAYLDPHELTGAALPAPSLVAANLLASEIDPLVFLSRAGTSDGQAFVYCTDGQKGRIVGAVDYFPHPFSPENCATRLLERPGGVSRLLAVSEGVEVMHELRTLLGRARCSMTVALDSRQALDLIELVHPDVVLIDMSLPRGEGVDLLSRLRGPGESAEMDIALLWTQPHDERSARRRLPRLLVGAAFASEQLAVAIEALLCRDPEEANASAHG